jgi:hypothetical protein
LHSITNDITNADFRAVGPIGLLKFNDSSAALAHLLNKKHNCKIHGTTAKQIEQLQKKCTMAIFLCPQEEAVCRAPTPKNVGTLI